MKLYGTDDRVEVKIDDITVYISPLTVKQKMNIQPNLMAFRTKLDYAKLMEASCDALRFCVKDIKGITKNGQGFKLEFEGDILSEKCIDDLMNLQCTGRLVATCIAFVDNVPEKIIDPETKEELEGVTIVNPTEGKRE